ncbi:hypothetical protein ACFOY8_14395 [Thalassospira xianhensis]|uniref:Uncharacterized protein n=1 Tax=Thalassospira xianhensis MCCC 1A02616 TaxID=1177929 RepID=A0A367UH77_9PROT|nr:hypothetical protein [Thalassospira xianhensis]RCK07657.1 hypothetical protein TH5_00860 [Thalassospira xianhensis MCCC 1A02616]
MKVTETKKVTREIHVASCIKCGSDDVQITDCGYSSFNMGGGTCKSCKHSVSDSCDISPSKDELARIWNKKNDIKALIAAQQKKIETATSKIEELKALDQKYRDAKAGLKRTGQGFDLDARSKRMQALNKKGERAVGDFNSAFPVGSPVTLELDGGHVVDTTVSAPAQMMCGHPSAWFSGVSGSYHIGCVRPK